MDGVQFPFTSANRVVGAQGATALERPPRESRAGSGARGARWVAACLVATGLVACGVPYAPQALPLGHPASPETAEAPLPTPSRALSAEPVSPPDETGDDGAGGNGAHAHHGGHS